MQREIPRSRSQRGFRYEISGAVRASAEWVLKGKLSRWFGQCMSGRRE